MFTGLIQAMGSVVRIAPWGNMRRVTISTIMEKPEWIIGESIAVNGACLTLVRGVAGEFDVDVSPETLQRTTLGTLSPGEPVNLERAMRLDDRLGGHFVTGHVDGVGIIILHRDVGGVVEMEISVPESWW
jgi:riboflavin synthase